jgi:hypothetical protein
MKKPSQHLIAEVPRSVIKVELTIGIDLGDVWSHYSTLRRWGLRLAACGGKQCHNRAIVAVAANSQFCFIASGSHKSRTSRSMQ